MRRFFGRIDEDKAIVDGDEFKHLSFVIRLKPGDKFICLCGDKFEYLCQIQKIEKNRVIASILDKSAAGGVPQKNIVLFQAVPKREAFETIIQKSCELGAAELVPFESDFVVKSQVNIDRCNAIIRSACKQCQRPTPMKILPLTSFDEMLKSLAKFDVVLFANEIDGGKVDFAEKIKNSQNIAVVIGAEGGFSAREKDAIACQKNVLSLSLGSRILRADTAAILLLGMASLFSGN